MKTCSAAGCNRPPIARSLCTLHYQRAKAAGALPDPLPTGEPLAWLKRNVSHSGDECLVWPFGSSGNGRGEVRLNGKRITAARAMCILVHGAPTFPGAQAAHSCGNGSNGCVNPDHLRWDTPIGNAGDRLLHGTDIRGEKHPLVKLSSAQVLQIARSSYGVDELAEAFGVAKTTIKSIRSGRNWGWLTGIASPGRRAA